MAVLKKINERLLFNINHADNKPKKIQFTNVPFSNDDLLLDLNNIKHDLNAAKNEMELVAPNKHSQEILSRILRNINLYKTLPSVIQQRYNAQVTSIAWVKIYEMLETMQLITTEKVSVFCNAELPGSFISAINHYCAVQNIELSWYGSSLYPKAHGC